MAFFARPQLSQLWQVHFRRTKDSPCTSPFINNSLYTIVRRYDKSRTRSSTMYSYWILTYHSTFSPSQVTLHGIATRPVVHISVAASQKNMRCLNLHDSLYSHIIMNYRLCSIWHFILMNTRTCTWRLGSILGRFSSVFFNGCTECLTTEGLCIGCLLEYRLWAGISAFLHNDAIAKFLHNDVIVKF